MSLNRKAQIEKLKTWALKNYENGADTFVECWEDADYDKLLTESNGNYEQALDVLSRVASVYAERQADAAFHQSQAQ